MKSKKLIKHLISCLLFTLIPLVATGNDDYEIDGLIIDQAITPVGHAFYDDFINGWEPPNFSGSILVRERPDKFSGSIVFVEVNDESVYESRLGFRSIGIEDKALEAREYVKQYIRETNEVMKELEAY